MVEIRHLGHAAFSIKNDRAHLIIDPFDPKQLAGYQWEKQLADLVCITHNHYDHNYVAGVEAANKDKKLIIIRHPGEYEVLGVIVASFAAWHDEKKGKTRGPMVLYRIEMEDLIIVHLGDLGHLLTEEQYEELEAADILMVPVGGFFTINAEQAVEITNHINPSYVLPMHFGVPGCASMDELKLAPPDDFLKASGLAPGEPVTSLKIKSRADLPEETKVVLFKSNHG